MGKAIFLLIALVVLVPWGFADEQVDGILGPDAARNITEDLKGEQPAAQGEVTYRNYSEEKETFQSFRKFFGDHTVFSIEGVFQPRLDADQNGVENEIDQIGYRINLGHHLHISDTVSLGVGVENRFYYIRLSDTDINGDEDLRLGAYDLPLELSVELSDRLLLKVGFESQFHTDHQELEWRNVMFEATVEIGYMLTPTLYVEAGVWIYDHFDRIQYFPTVGVVWNETEFDVTIKIPHFARARYWVRKDANIFFYYESDRNQFRTRVEDTSQDLEIIYESYNVGFGFEYFLDNAMSIHALAGATVEGDIRIDDQADIEIAEGLFVKAGFTINSGIFD